MWNERRALNLVTVNNRFARMITLNFISLIMSAIIFAAWIVLCFFALFVGYMIETWWYVLIIIIPYGFGLFSSSRCYGKSKRYYYYDYDPVKRADGDEKTINIAANLMWNSWANKAASGMFIATDVIINYSLFEIIATIASAFMVWANIEAIQICIAFGIQEELSIALIVITVVLLITSRVLTWASVGLLANNCHEIEREYNQIMADRKREEEAEQKFADRSRRRVDDVKQLLAESGFKFFLKYYQQIVRLGIKDVVVEEDYSPTEIAERLKAAKKLIDSGLAPAAAQQILEKFSDLLTSEEKEIALRIAG